MRLGFHLCVPCFLNINYPKHGQKNVHFFYKMPACSDLAACLEGALTQLTQCPSAGQQFPLDLQLIGSCHKRPGVPCCAGLISSSFWVCVGRKGLAVGRKGIVPGAWLWWKCWHPISSLPPQLLAVCWEEPRAVLSEVISFLVKSRTRG